MSNSTDRSFLKKYIIQKICWTILALLLVVVINILINKYAGGRQGTGGVRIGISTATPAN